MRPCWDKEGDEAQRPQLAVKGGTGRIFDVAVKGSSSAERGTALVGECATYAQLANSRAK
jgi:hypothetical protein